MEKHSILRIAGKKRLLGVAVPVGALRTKHSVGAGEFSDLYSFALLCKKMKIGLIQILPVNDTGFESSPYASLTAFGLHPLYLRIEELNEFGSISAAVKKQIQAAKKKFSGNDRFLHYEVLKEKLNICRKIYDANAEEIVKSAGGGTLKNWIKQNSWIKQYAVYRRLKEANEQKSWKEWNEYKTITASDIDALWKDNALRKDHVFWVWMQHALDEQFFKVAYKIAEMGIILKGDLPILMNEDSCDVWAHPEYFNQKLSAGAPPDMYSPEGQNWGFPIYNWNAHEKDNFVWWRARLAAAGKYYNAYRIDHVLGFFRIWANSQRDYSAVLGRFVPYKPITTNDLKKIGFNKDRIRWASLPHIPTNEVWDTLKNNWGSLYAEDELNAAANKVFSKALVRVNKEELWLFNKKIQGEKDIDALGLHPAIRNYLFKKWGDRVFLEYEKGKFFPTWKHESSTAYNSFSKEEKNTLHELMEKTRMKSEKIGAALGKKLLSVLVESTPMLACAEDLGAVPDCVPKTLSKLKIFGLKVSRWVTRINKNENTYIPFEDYPQLSVCTASVHDTSTVRQWWENEADQKKYAGFIGVPSLPKIYNPGTAKIILSKTASARSRFRVFQVQDILHLSNNWYSENPHDERINVPGTSNAFNWTYRLPANIEKIAKDKELILAVRALVKVKPAKKVKKENL